jgi:hypothetical protein
MTPVAELDRIAISVKSHRLLKLLLNENPTLDEIMRNSKNETEALVGVRNWVLEKLRDSPEALAYYEGRCGDRRAFESLEWSDYAAIRILDYIDNAGREFVDLNLRGQLAVSDPITLIWLAVNRGTGGAKPAFFEDRGGSQPASRWRAGWRSTPPDWIHASWRCARRIESESSTPSSTASIGARSAAASSLSTPACRRRRSTRGPWSGGPTCAST